MASSLRTKNGMILVNIEIYRLKEKKKVAILIWVGQTWPLLVNFPLVQETSAGGSQAVRELPGCSGFGSLGKEAAPERAHSLDWMHTEILEPSNGHMWMPRGHFQLEEGGHMKEEGGLWVLKFRFFSRTSV